VRAVLGPVETRLWEQADVVAGDVLERRAAFVAEAWRAVDAALVQLGV
jgi:hypothetical protein